VTVPTSIAATAERARHRAPGTRRVPSAARAAGIALVTALLLTWGQVADGLVLITGAAPMAVACGARAWAARRCRPRTDPGQPRTDPGQPSTDPGHRGPGLGQPGPGLALAAAAIASVGLARAAEVLIRLSGGFVLKPVAARFAGLPAMPHHVTVTTEGVLALFGADFSGPHSRAGLAIAAGHLIGAAGHLIGAAAAGAAVLIALSRLGRGQEPAVPALALAIVFNITAFLPTPYVQNLLSTREISAVLPFGAVLAGRVLAAPLARALGGGRLAAGLAAAGAACAVALGYHAAQPAVPAQNQPLASWLAARHLSAGLAADYWVANSTTLDAGGRITVRQVSLRYRVLGRPLSWGFKQDWYDPATSYANFLVASDKSPGGWGAAAFRTFGPPAQTLHLAGYTVLVWHKNLLAAVR
jgi:hypothetical protein